MIAPAMDLAQFVDVFLRLDKHLEAVVAQYGVWVRAILFATCPSCGPSRPSSPASPR